MGCKKAGKKKGGGGGGGGGAAGFSTMDVDPRRVRYAHSKIKPIFSGCGRTIEQTLGEIRDGKTRVSDLPMITVLLGPLDPDDGQQWFFSLNNRRLFVFKACREENLLGPSGLVRVRARALKAHERERYTVERCSLQAKFLFAPKPMPAPAPDIPEVDESPTGTTLPASASAPAPGASAGGSGGGGGAASATTAGAEVAGVSTRRQRRSEVETEEEEEDGVEGPTRRRRRPVGSENPAAEDEGKEEHQGRHACASTGERIETGLGTQGSNLGSKYLTRASGGGSGGGGHDDGGGADDDDASTESEASSARVGGNKKGRRRRKGGGPSCQGSG